MHASRISTPTPCSPIPSAMGNVDTTLNDIVPIDRTLSISEALVMCPVPRKQMEHIIHRFGIRIKGRMYISESVLQNIMYAGVQRSKDRFHEEFVSADPWIDFVSSPPSDTGEYLVCTSAGEVKLIRIRKGVNPRTKYPVVGWMEKPKPRKDTIAQ